MLSDYFPIYIYFGLVVLVTLVILGFSSLFQEKNGTPTKYLPYESGMQTQTHLLQERFPLHHYLVALVFLVIDIEVIFMYPWAVIAKSIGSFAFYEMTFFILILFVGFCYVWRKGGLQWE